MAIRITLDAAHDLGEGGRCTCDACADAFAEAFAAAADDIAEERGIEIEVVRCRYGSPESFETRGDRHIAETLWQESHDNVLWDDDSRPEHCVQVFAARARDAIDDAIEAWTECDWTHEQLDDTGDFVCDDDGHPVYCEGGNPDECSRCGAVNESIEDAHRCGRQAQLELARGDLVAARHEVELAVGEENQWGDAPVWRPVLKLFEEQLDS